MAFRTFIEQRAVRRTKAGAFIRMCKRDRELPDAETWEELSSYLRSKHASKEVLDRARRVWLDYKEWANKIFDEVLYGDDEDPEGSALSPLPMRQLNVSNTARARSVDFGERVTYEEATETQDGVPPMDLTTYLHNRNKSASEKGEIVEFLKHESDPATALDRICDEEHPKFTRPGYAKAAKRLRWEFEKAVKEGVQPRRPAPTASQGGNAAPEAPRRIPAVPSEGSGLAVFYDSLLRA